MMNITATVKKRYDLALENQRPKFERFNDFDYIFHSKLKYFDPNIPSKVFNPSAWSFVETIVTRMLSKDPVVSYKPREVSDNVQSSIHSDMFSYWYDKDEVYPKMVEWVKSSLIYGTGIVKIDWYTSPTRFVKSYVYDENGEAIIDENGKYVIKETPTIDYDDPRLQNVNIYDFFVDPMATSIDDAKWVIHQYWVDIEELEQENKKAEQFGKVVYSKSGLKKLKASKISETEFEQERRRASGYNDNKGDNTVDRVKIWEMWEDNKCVVIADESIVLREEENYYWHGKKPFIRIVDSINIKDFYGKGEIEPIEKIIHAINTVQNQRITNVNRILSPMWKAKGTVDDEELQFTDNGIIHVNDINDADFVPMPNVTQTAIQEQNTLMEVAQRALGVTDYVQGLQTPGQTAKEVEIKTSQANSRFAHKVKLFESMGLRKLGEFVYQLYQQFVTTSKVVRVVGQSGEKFVRVTADQLSGEYDVTPESESTLEEDKAQDFTRFINLFQLMQPFFSQETQDPVTGQMIQTGFIDRDEMIKELINKSGEKDPERFYANRGIQDQNPTGQGQIPQAISQEISGIEGLQGIGQF